MLEVPLGYIKVEIRPRRLGRLPLLCAVAKF
jgi:hypothetical protein